MPSSKSVRNNIIPAIFELIFPRKMFGLSHKYSDWCKPSKPGSGLTMILECIDWVLYLICCTTLYLNMGNVMNTCCCIQLGKKGIYRYVYHECHLNWQRGPKSEGNKTLENKKDNVLNLKTIGVSQQKLLNWVYCKVNPTVDRQNCNPIECFQLLPLWNDRPACVGGSWLWGHSC